MRYFTMVILDYYIIPSNEISNILTVNFAQEIENKSIGSFLKSIVPPDGNSVR